jgi:hypothetical protein
MFGPSYRLLIPSVAYLILPPLAAPGATPERMVVDTYDEFAKGQSPSTSITDTGILRSAPDLRTLGEAGQGQAWAILPDKDGSYLVATSPEGKLMRVTPDGKSTLVTQFPETHLYAMARDTRGDLFVATSPDGRIYRLQPGDKPETWFDPDEKYIWALAFGPDGHLYAGTGTEGKIYRVTGKGSGDIFYDSDETHIRSLAFGKDGALLAGSSDQGYLYRVPAANQGVVLCATGTQEVNAIVVAPDGAVYFSGVGKPKGDAKSAPTTGLPGPRLPPALSSLLRPKASNGGGNGSAPAASPAGSKDSAPKGEASKLFRLDPGTLFGQPIWETDQSILTLLGLGEFLYAGTGGDGYLYEITPRGEATRLLQIEGGGISAAAALPESHVAAATSNPAKVLRIGGTLPKPGVYESDVLDSKTFARWGSVTLKSSQGQPQVRTRSGNTPKPDKSWYDWLPLEGDQSGSPDARYLQIELQLPGKTRIDRFEVVYLPKNLPPRIERLDIMPAGFGYLSIIPPPQPLQPKTHEQLIQQAEKGEGNPEVEPPIRYQPQEARGLRTAVWKISDPNGDELESNLYFSLDTQPRAWRLLADKLKENVLSWDTSGWPDGNYYLKVETHDGPDNAPEDTLQDEFVSKLMNVDNTAPTITITSVSGGQVAFTVSDEASMLLEVTVSRNGREFLVLRPLDGILDGKTEKFSAKLAAGEVLFIRAQDQTGNVRSAMAEAP